MHSITFKNNIYGSHLNFASSVDCPVVKVIFVGFTIFLKVNGNRDNRQRFNLWFGGLEPPLSK